MFRDRKKIKPLSIDIDLLGMMPKGQSLEDFIDNLVLIEASDGSPEIKVGEFPQIFEAILYLIQAIQQSRISGKPKQVAQKLNYLEVLSVKDSIVTAKVVGSNSPMYYIRVGDLVEIK